MKTVPDTTATQALIDRLALVVDGVSHDVVLFALLAMYRTTALHYPCCTAAAAIGCVRLGDQLLAAAEPNRSFIH